MQQKALLKLMDLNFSILYKKGINNNAVDALSRCPQPEPICSLSVCSPSWMSNLMQGYSDDSDTKELLTELAVSGSNSKGFTLLDGIIRYKGRVWIGNNALARQHILQAVHSSGIGGHSGFHGTYHRIKSLFAWPNMKNSIRTYIKECPICQ